MPKQVPGGGARDRASQTHVPAVIGLLLGALLSAVSVVPEAARAYTPHAPIFINGDAEFTPANGVTGGSGTPSDPYLIEGWEINASVAPGIRVWNTNASFVIRGVDVHSGGFGFAGLYYWNVSHGRLENSTVSDNAAGLYVDFSDNVTVGGNAFSGNRRGVSVSSSSDIVVESNVVAGGLYFGVSVRGSVLARVANNTFSGNGFGLELEGTTYATVSGNTFTGEGILLVEYPLGRAFGSLPPYYNTHVISADNLVNGRPVLYYANCGSAVVASVPVGQLIAANCNSLQASNLQISGTDLAVQVIDVTDVILDSVTATNNLEGVYLARVTNATLRNTWVDGTNGWSVGHGAILWLVDNASFLDSRLTSNSQNGAYFGTSAGDVVVDNTTVSGNGRFGMFFETTAQSLTVRNSTIASNSIVGIMAIVTGGVVLTGNNVSGNGWGVGVFNMASVLATGNLFASNGADGLRLGNCSGLPVRVENNTLRSNGGSGLSLSSCNVVAVNNTVESNHVGIGGLLVDSVFADNVLVDNLQSGIRLDGSANVTVTRNLFRGHAGEALLLNSTSAVITFNELDANPGAGIVAVWSNGLLVHHNTLTNNTVQASDDQGAANAWDDGYPSGGNYWSDYGGVDTCSGPNQDVCPDPDGIGDTPHPIDADSGDRYPLMSPAPVPTDLPPSLQINGPDGGERYSGGFPQEVVWTMSDSDTVGDLLVDIEVSVDGGALYTPIVLALPRPQGQNRYPWDVPCIDTQSGRVRVTISDGNSSTSETSAPDFAIDCTPPWVVSTEPPASQANVSLSAPIRVVFSEPMDPKATPLAFSISPAVANLNFTFGGAGEILIVRHDPLEPCTSYTATIDATATDFTSPGNPIATPYTWTFTTTCAPFAEFLSPMRGEAWTGGSVHEVVWTMSDEDAALFVSVDYSLDGGADGYPYPAFAGVLPTGMVRVPWTVPRVDSESVRLRLAVTDSSGRSTTVESERFTIDSTPPIIVSVTPADGSRGVGLDTEVRIVFDGPVNRTSAEAAFVLDPDPTGLVYRWEATDAGDPVLVVSHDPFDGGVAYDVRLRTSLRDDGDPGNPLATDVVFRFTTAPPPGRPWDPFLILLGAGIALASALWAFEPSRVALLTILLAGAHRRKLGDDLELEVRGMVRGYIQVHPGDPYTDIRRNLDLNNGALTYHLAKLERDRIIKSRMRDGRKRYYPAKAVVPVRENGELYEVQRELVRTVAREPGLPVAILAAKFGISSQLALYHLRRLSGRGHVSLERRGIRLRAYPRENGARASVTHPEGE